MATITLTIPNNIVTRVIDGFVFDKGWNVDNPLTKAQFAQSELLLYIKKSVKAYETNQAVSAAKATAEASVDTDIILS